MQVSKLRRLLILAVLALFLTGGIAGAPAFAAAAAPANGTVHLVFSDDPTDNWSMIGFKVLNVSLMQTTTVQKSIASAATGTEKKVVSIYTAPSPAPTLNLIQLDQLGELMGSVSVAPGTYSSVQVVFSADPKDVSLVTSADPEPGFDLAAGYTVPASNIVVQGGKSIPICPAPDVYCWNTSASTAMSPKVVVVRFNLSSPLVVTSNASQVLDLELNLRHPAFIVEHWPATQAQPVWVINLNAALRRKAVLHPERQVLRHNMGQVESVSADNSSITVQKDFAPSTGSVPIATKMSYTVQADATNGTLFFDLDAKTKTKLTSFASVATSLTTGNAGKGKYVRVAARYQAGGNLVAVRIWASDTFKKVWISPEGHVVHVDRTNNIMNVANENGKVVPVHINSETNFYFRAPQNAKADATPINSGTGIAFFDGATAGGLPNVARGFKVHVNAVDPLATQLVAESVDIEIASFSGTISAANSSGFNVTRTFATGRDNYKGTLPYIAATAPNINNGSGSAITGFDWWYLTFPTLADTGATAVSDFVSLAQNVATYNLVPEKVWGLSYAAWGDGTTTNPTGWHARGTIIEPTALPKGKVTTAAAAIANGITFGMTAVKGTATNGAPVTVDLSTVGGAATLVYEVHNVSGIVTISQLDVTKAANQTALITALADGTNVKVYGVPAVGGAVKAYTLFYYVGTTSRD